MEDPEQATRVEKPWGWELWWTVTERYVGKVIFVNAGRRLSLQYHNHKDESIYVIEGEMILHLENDAGALDPIPLGAGEVLGKSPSLLQGPDTDGAILDQLRKDLRSGRNFEGRATNYRKDGTPFTMHWRVAPVKSDHGTVRYYIAVQREG